MQLVTPDIGLLFWMLVSFLIVLFLLKKFAWKPVLRMLHQREESIEQALKAADRARDDMHKMRDDNEKILAEARLERERIYREAQEMKEQIVSNAREQAKKEQSRIVDETKTLIQTEKNAAIKEIRSVTAELAVQVAEKLLRQELSKDLKQKDLVDKLTKDLVLN
ncbi:MAG: F0F1 ATP synthase subunit B [Bacteroidales bacterium]|jgi:F-type H+-transporting ATPase subunit b|nr:F0F1 ATP synthase subunit B [Bacteroidales bacterium]